jgi:hypothetical protein
MCKACNHEKTNHDNQVNPLVTSLTNHVPLKAVTNCVLLTEPH